jgi:hypothetical protein
MFIQMAHQINTAPTPRNTTEIKTGEKQIPLSNRLIGLVNHVAQSHEYVKLRSDNVPHTEAYRGAVDALVDSPDNGFDNFHTALLKVTGGLGTFVEAEAELEQIAERRTSADAEEPKDDQKRSRELKLEYSIPFNHSLKTLINEGPNVNMIELTSALTKTHEIVFNRYDNFNPSIKKNPSEIISANNTFSYIERHLAGIRHEVAAETMFIAAGIDYSHDVTPEEDRNGADIIAYIERPSVDDDELQLIRVPIDIKASNIAEANARTHRPERITAWTGLKNVDFTGTKGNTPNALAISYDVGKEHAGDFVERIHQGIDLYEKHKGHISKSLGSIALK